MTRSKFHLVLIVLVAMLSGFLFTFVIGMQQKKMAAQYVAGTSMQNGNGVPSGSCFSGSTYIDTSTGSLWACKSGSWMLMATPGFAPLRGTTGTITGTLLALGSCNTGTATITGATTGMPALASPVSDPGTGIVWNALVTSANTVTVKECALVLSTPNNTAYNVVVNP